MNIKKLLFIGAFACVVSQANASTYYVFNRGAIAKEGEQELRAFFQPLQQQLSIQNELEKRNNGLIVAIADRVAEKHRLTPFKTQVDAKEYVTVLAKLFGFDTFASMAEQEIEVELKKAPDILNKTALKQAIKEKVMRDALFIFVKDGNLTEAFQKMSTTIQAEINQRKQQYHNWSHR